ncbi:hypothetical protein G5B99_00740 [Campylobacter concisus]|uniref:Uncharacterized protein n=1 Tax=Campylobacter concisus TaxID=199 RepID=A0A7S9X4A2_9BACT|nr:hypothetical protein CVS89_00730 [Campylobacter concisus]QPI04079.1 hypothetical protein G5B99_00740 [Campylobacter concisus]
MACLTIKKFAANELRERNFHSACNFDIVKLNDKILPESEQNLKFLKQIKSTFFDKKRLMKFSKFRLVQPKISFINLNYKQANFLLNLA